MSKVTAKETFFSVQADMRVFEGEEVEANSKIALANPEKFSGNGKSTKKVEKVEEPKEELLIEEPVAVLEVEEVQEEKEEKPRRKRRKKSSED